jgi:1-acyl-sn-glycerol-3-phosphate acyltransferase
MQTGTTWQTRWTRRLVAIPLVAIGAVVMTLSFPVLGLGALAFDLVTGRRRFPSARLLTFVAIALWLEVCAVVLAAQMWLIFVRRLGSPASLRQHNSIEKWWVRRLVGVAGWTLGLRFEVSGPATLQPGPVVAIGRHASHADAFLPAWVLGVHHGLDLRYVIAAGLTWGPAFNLFGHRLPNFFVNRDKTHGTPDLSPIASLAATAGPNDAVIIFPEGQFFTPERQARALARITDPVLAARARRLRHLMPPRPAGTLALLYAAPLADVVVISHVGLERFQTAADFWRNVPLTRPVQVRVERIPAADVPRHDSAATVRWLTDTWQDMDRWISATVPKPLKGAI